MWVPGRMLTGDDAGTIWPRNATRTRKSAPCGVHASARPVVKEPVVAEPVVDGEAVTGWTVLRFYYEFVGAGVVKGSTPEREWIETERKAAALLAAAAWSR